MFSIRSRCAIVALGLCLLLASGAGATGLYKGHGMRSKDYGWDWRINGAVGFHGVEDPWDQFGVNSYPVGGYTSLGVELPVLAGQSLEILGLYHWVSDRERIVAVGPGYIPRPGVYRYEVDAWTAAATWRFYYPRGSSSGYLGGGAGWVFGSDLEYFEQIETDDPFLVRASGSGPEVHLVAGFDGIPGPRVRMGVEIGFRYSWVDFDQGIYGAGNFNGFFLGFRIGFASAR